MTKVVVTVEISEYDENNILAAIARAPKEWPECPILADYYAGLFLKMEQLFTELKEIKNVRN